MPRKLIIDLDGGVDDAVALILALTDPRFELVAATAVAGAVSSAQATRNLQGLIELLDPPRRPRVGAALDPEPGMDLDRSELFGRDGLCGFGLPVADLHHRHSSEKVLLDELRPDPGIVSLLACGPLTNVAQLLRRDPNLAGDLGPIVAVGGTYRAAGDVSPAAEFNFYFDPFAARDVFRSRVPLTIIPLDVTSQVVLTLDHLDQLPDESSAVGRFLRRTLTSAFRAQRQHWGQEGLWLPAAVGFAALAQPELFTFKPHAGDVETVGELTTGASVFDRRPLGGGNGTIEVAMEVDSAGVVDVLLRAAQQAAQGLG